MENSITITKNPNGNGNVTVSAPGGYYNLLPESYITKQKDSVIVRGKDGALNEFFVEEVKEVVREDTTVVAIADVDTLFDELNNNFFFSLGSGGGMPSGSLTSKEITQNLVTGNNNINHALGKSIIGFNVLDGNDFVEATGSIVDSNNFTINLAGGNINNAKIILFYTA